MVRALGFVGVCIVLSGLLVNAYLAIVARNVSPAEYSDFGAFWSIALLVGFGAFLPVEQELARLGPRALRSAAVVAAGMAVVECALAVFVSPAVVVLCFLSAAQFLVRGALIGNGKLAWHGGLLVADTTLRVVFALLAGWLGATTSAQFEWTLVAAVAVAHLPVLAAIWWQGDGEVPVREFARAVSPLLVGSLCAQLLLNGIPVLVTAIATPAERAQAGVFLAAFLLARVPLFVAVPLQTALLPVLAGKQKRTVVTRLAAVLAVAAVAGAAVAFTIGPWLVRLVFGPLYVVSATDLALVALGVVAHLGLIVTTQALVADALHSRVAWSWIAGVLTAAATFALIPDLLLRAEIAFLTGSLAGLLVGLRLLTSPRQESELCSTTSSSP
ncbi:lipopolysaccharide biosynthesis protein [Lentzea sp. NPDC092896]|uniref:lipopolysaccharide biosynthesis protein n=1 Tax=Lentzea sp. NPDC092896 TaxID=3364127 RepID=UPI00381B2390